MKVKRLEQFIKYQSLLTQQDLERVAKIGRPGRILFRRTPRNLDDLTIGQLIDLWSITNDYDLFYVSLRVVLGVKRYTVARRVRIGRVIGWMNFMQAELLRIADMWRAIEHDPTPEEFMAGIDRLNSGFFGIIDAYAKRMGFRDHDDVMNVKWIIIYECMKMDVEGAEFQRRLQKQIAKKPRP